MDDHPTVIAAIARLLHERTGLDVSTVGRPTVERAVRKRMNVCDIEDVKSYTDLLETSSVEMMGLIDEAVIPETWFFRDGEPFAALSEFIRTQWIPSHRGKPMRVLSLPCSTGEEAYSIAIVLYECGLNRQQTRIDAVDISHRSIETARRASYGPHSFRERRHGLREHYFQRCDGVSTLIEPVREMVDFHHGNLLEPYSLPCQGPYDVIFCRNLLTYFDKPTQRRAAKILNGLLATGGMLFLGHAETGHVLDAHLRPLERKGSFGFRKMSAEELIAATAQRPKSPVGGRNAPRPEPRGQARRSPTHPVAPGVNRGDGGPIRNTLAQVMKLADQGRVGEAVAVCERYLLERRECAQAYYLLGVLSESSGKEQQAEQMMRKAIDLKPDHQDALAHLAALAERRGDRRAAEAFRHCLRRIGARAAASEEGMES